MCRENERRFSKPASDGRSVSGVLSSIPPMSTIVKPSNRAEHGREKSLHDDTASCDASESSPLPPLAMPAIGLPFNGHVDEEATDAEDRDEICQWESPTFRYLTPVELPELPDALDLTSPSEWAKGYDADICLMNASGLFKREGTSISAVGMNFVGKLLIF